MSLEAQAPTPKVTRRRWNERRVRIWILTLLIVTASLAVGFLAWEYGADTLLTRQRYADPREQAVWIAGKAALRHQLNRPEYNDFGRSAVVISAGDLTSFCGTFDVREQEGIFAKRFVALDGRRDTAIIEYQTTNFDVLWNRLCVPEKVDQPSGLSSLNADCSAWQGPWRQKLSTDATCSIKND